jgi:hypothetical protein
LHQVWQPGRETRDRRVQPAAPRLAAAFVFTFLIPAAQPFLEHRLVVQIDLASVASNHTAVSGAVETGYPDRSLP